MLAGARFLEILIAETLKEGSDRVRRVIFKRYDDQLGVAFLAKALSEQQFYNSNTGLSCN